MVERVTKYEAIGIFKKYDEEFYEYYCKSENFFVFNAVDYAKYLKEKYETKQE